jgi:pyrimidine operon attenuation protein/uracil phosphoribosyltransferase
MRDCAIRERRILYDARELGELLDAMARQCAGLLAQRPSLTVVGVLRRGVPIAQALCERLVRDWQLPAPAMLQLKIERYADDLTLLHPDTRLTEDPALAHLDLTGHTVLLVDDVLYRGHSLLRAVQWLATRQPAEIRVAVLADRRVARLPVHADVVGAQLAVAPDDVIECHVPPYEPELAIELARPARD